MNRRKFLGASLSVPLVAMMPVSQQRKRYGYLDVEGHRAHKELTGEDLHVFFQGKDITSSCREVDDVKGYAEIFCRDEQGHRDWEKQGHIHIHDVDGVCRMRLTGDILIVPAR